MLARDYRQIPEESAGEGKTIRWVVGRPEGAPNFAMRVIEFQPGAIFETHHHPFEHEAWRKGPRGRFRCDRGSLSTSPPTSPTATGTPERVRCASSASSRTWRNDRTRSTEHAIRNTEQAHVTRRA